MSEYDIFPSEAEIVIPVIGSHRTLTKFQPPEREFVEPDASDKFIWWLFRYRCVDCKRAGTEINEIIPRSRSKNSILDWHNRVVLCQTCHIKYHEDGVNNVKIQRMQSLRSMFLKSHGRAEYLTL